MRKTTIPFEWGKGIKSQHTKIQLHSDPARWAEEAEFLRYRYVREVQKKLEDEGYTTHPDVILDNTELHRTEEASTMTHVIHMLFPPSRPKVGEACLLVGGPGHGMQAAFPAGGIIEIAHARPAWEDGGSWRAFEDKAAYELSGFNVAVGAWEMGVRP